MGKRLRFAMVTTFYPPYHFGGDATLVQALTHALARRGHQVDVIHDVDAFRMRHRGDEPEPLTEPEGVRVHALRSRFGPLSCLATQQFGRPLFHGSTIRHILSQGFDVIHFHNISLVGGPGVLSLGEGIKLYTTHEHWLVCPTHVLWRHKRELCTGRECLRCVLRHGRPPQLWRYTKILQEQCKQIDAFISPSTFCADKHREFGFRPEMRVVPNFLPDSVDTVADPASTSTEQVRPYFLFVGRLEHIKGLQDVIPLIQNDGPAELWIAGTGTDEAELRRIAEGRSGVRFLGQQTAEQLRGLYRRARALIAPSICYEVFGLIVLEAFREGAPVIARNRGAYRELVIQSQGGVLFETQNELKRAMDRLATDDQLRNQLGEAGRQAFRNNWSETVILNRYFELIEQIAQKRKAHTSRENTEVAAS